MKKECNPFDNNYCLLAYFLYQNKSFERKLRKATRKRNDNDVKEDIKNKDNIGNKGHENVSVHVIKPVVEKNAGLNVRTSNESINCTRKQFHMCSCERKTITR